MNFNENQTIHVAILDLYEGHANQGMRCIRQIINEFGLMHQLNIVTKEFDVRLKNELPDTNFDIYISTGGPGSPTASEGKKWSGTITIPLIFKRNIFILFAILTNWYAAIIKWVKSPNASQQHSESSRFIF